jgi:hypothetical protein
VGGDDKPGHFITIKGRYVTMYPHFDAIAVADDPGFGCVVAPVMFGVQGVKHAHAPFEILFGHVFL